MEKVELQPSTRTPSSLPVIHDLQPQYYDGYSGEGTIPARVSYVPTEYNAEGASQKAVIRLADMWIHPYRDAYQPKDVRSHEEKTPPPATIIYIGGGDSDALASTGLAGYIRDAQRRSLEEHPESNWYAQNIITVSHPTGAPRTTKTVAENSMKLSAEIVHSALKQAVKDRSINAEYIPLPEDDIELKNIVLIGSSAGGALATELAALIGEGCRQLVLEEPAAMGEHRNIEWHFLTSGLYGAYRDALRQGVNPLQAVQVALEDARISWTLPEGAPTSWAELLKSFLPTKSKFVDLGRIFRLQPNIHSHELSAAALGHDTTAEARQKITCPVTIIGSAESNVVNLYQDRGNLTTRELRRVTQGHVAPETREKVLKLLRDLFPHARERAATIVPGFGHSSLGRNATVWEHVFSNIQQIDIAA